MHKDYKKCFNDIDLGKQRLQRDLALELEKPFTSFDKLQGIKPQDKVIVVKIRIADPFANAGKQSGLRCIVLIDRIRSLAILLHVYSKKIKPNLKRKEIENLQLFHTSYLNS